MTYALIVTTTVNGKQSSGWRHLRSDATTEYVASEAKRMSALPHVDYLHVERNNHTHDPLTHTVIESTYVNGERVR